MRRQQATDRLARIEYLLRQRKMEGLALFVPLLGTAEWIQSTARYCIADGSNRAGKTVAAAAKVAFILSGQAHWQPKENGRAMLVGRNFDHIQTTMWAKLAMPGAFKIIRDEKTRQWRAVRPDSANPTLLDPYDLAYQEQWRESPPLLPERIVSKVAWQDTKQGVPHLVFMRNGWQCICRTGNSQPERGTERHLGWFDEHIESPQFFYEFVRGATSVNGQLIWSATPQDLDPELERLRRRFDEGDTAVAAIKLLIENNPYLTPERKAEFYRSIPEEERQVRWYGEYARATRLVYRIFDPAVHLCDPFDIPRDWCCYLSIDPGIKLAGAVLAAVDPDETHYYVFAAKQFRSIKGPDDVAIWARDALAGRHLEAMVIDNRAGRQRGIGGPVAARVYWRDALARQGIVPARKGPCDGFLEGSSDIEARENALRAWLQIRGFGHGAGTPMLKLFRGAVAPLDAQLRDCHYRFDDNAHKEVKNPKMEEDLLEALEYLSSVQTQLGYYVPDASTSPSAESVLDNFKRMHGLREATPTF